MNYWVFILFLIIFVENTLQMKYNINLTLSPKDKKSGKHSVRIRVSAFSNRVDLYTGISLSETQWNKKRQEVKQGCVVNNFTYNVINAQLVDYRKFIEDYFESCALRDVRPSLAELKEKFNRKYKMSDAAMSNEFFYLFDKFIEENSKERAWGEDMRSVYIRLKDIVKEFNPSIKFTDLSKSTMNGLVEYMSRTMYNDALIKRIGYLKRFVKWAQLRNYGVNGEFFLYSPKLRKAKKAVRYLEIEDLTKIYELDLGVDTYLDRIRDIFVFQCYTALRYSDIQQLKHENIILGKDGTYYIDILTKKDDDRIYFPLSNRALEIYKKYKERVYPNEKVFPVISNQKYNDYLKILGEKAELQGEWVDYEYRLNKMEKVIIPKKDLTTHTARRTFIVTAINENVDPMLISLITSHSDLKSMRPYITQNAKGAKVVIDAINRADATCDE